MSNALLTGKLEAQRVIYPCAATCYIIQRQRLNPKSISFSISKEAILGRLLYS